MAWVLGTVSPEELDALNDAGWIEEEPPKEFRQPNGDEDAMRMFYTDNDVFAIMSGPDWEPVNNPTPDYKRDYTVILLRPDYIADEYGKDIFHTFVAASTPGDAVRKAQAAAADADDAGGGCEADDYHALFVCAGKVAHLNWEITYDT